jgi:stage II sporulation protein D (peptidoglycan lytic transglycosylase)
VALSAGFTALASCVPEAPLGQPAPEQPTDRPPLPVAESPDERPAASAEPELRIGLEVGASSTTIGGGDDLVITDPSGARIAAVPAGEQWRVVPAGSGIELQPPGRAGPGRTEMIAVVATDPRNLVRVNGRTYRGLVELVRDSAGLTVVNRLFLEAYVAGVVSAEMGRRNQTEFEALKAQAVVSRTYALRNLRRRAALGFDLHAGVADQMYGGSASETPEGREAVGLTRGQTLTFDGRPIDAFYYSTCGGQTADGVEAFRAASRPYLHSFADVDEHGQAYCRISPRYRWREEWTGEALRMTLRRTLPATLGVGPDQASVVRDVWVAQRTGSGRVGQLGITLRADHLMVEGRVVRQVLRPASGELLRSTAFTLTASRSGQEITRLVAEGSGAGHGVGMCQWGAVGRSRAGQDYQRILAAYFPGATLQRLY